MIATQVVEDAEAGRVGRFWGYHAYNAVLKRALGKARAVMTLAELEAAVGWLERNRVADHLGLLSGDHRYEWVAAAYRRVDRQHPGEARFQGSSVRVGTYHTGRNAEQPAVWTGLLTWIASASITEQDELPAATAQVLAQYIGVAVRASQFGVQVVGARPAVEDLGHPDHLPGELNSARQCLTVGILLSLDRHREGVVDQATNSSGDSP
jgi:hypothetical protein